MATFTFDAPALFGASRSSGTGRKRLMYWLRDRLAARGVESFGPVADAFGWMLAVNAEDGLVSIRCAGRSGKPVTVVVEQLGEADAEYEDTVAAFEDALGSV